ncbi:MAG: YfhO family protein [Rhodothermaceae bacterium]
MKKEKKEKSQFDSTAFSFVKEKYSIIISVTLVFIVAMYLVSPYVFEGKSSFGEDAVSSSGSTKLYLEWQKETGEKAFWNPNIFGGMPLYHRMVVPIFHMDRVFGLLSSIPDWRFWYFFAGGLGFFLFLVYRKVDWYIAIISALVFMLLPDWQSHISGGHYVKFRTIMILPFLLLSFNTLIDKRNWSSAGFFALVFSWLVRAQHYQIIFYGILLLFILFIYPYLKLILEKKYKDVSSLTIKFVVAIVLTIMIAAQPFFSVKEYTPYSTRGGNAVQVNKQENTPEKSTGVSFTYATRWSLSPGEMLDFFGPRIHGGYQGEVYNGNKYPHLKGQTIPSYWGEKPLSGNYPFIGIIAVLLAITAVYFYKEDKFLMAVGAFVVFSLLLALGRHLPWFYKIFYDYLPYFSKFRAPAMAANISFIALLIMAAYGIKGLIQKYQQKDFKPLLLILGSGVLFSLSLYFFVDSFSFSAAGDKNYDSNVITMLKNIRKEFYLADVKKLILFTLLFSGVVFAFIKNKIKKEIFIGLILVLALVEVGRVTNLAMDKIQKNDRAQIEKKVFKEDNITRYLTKAKKGYRAIELGGSFTSNHYAYFYPTINGYSAIKLQVIQDVIENNLFKANTPNKINWNLISMLGGKYIILPGRMDADFLKLVAVEKSENKLLYENLKVFDKAWFVKNIEFLPQPKDVILEMNKVEFNPADVALVLEKDKFETNSFSAKGSIKVIEANPNEIKLEAKTDSEQFLVLSEIYYPAGWTAIINETETEIYKVNHLLRGIKIPAGKNKITFNFYPPTYQTGLILTWSGFIVALLLIVGSLYFERKKATELNK